MVMTAPPGRAYFAALFLLVPGFYALTPLLPVTGTGLPAAAAAVTAFAFFVLVPLVPRLARRPPSNTLLAAAAVASVLGVWGVNRSLYNFERTPPPSERALFIERADEVLFVEEGDGGQEPLHVIASYPKRFWLAKTFSLDVLLLTAAASLAVLVGKQVEKVSHIFAILFLGSVMDLWSVTRGMTEEIAASPFTSYPFLLNWPLAGKGGVTYPLIGAADFLFAALFLFLVCRFGLAFRRNVLGMAAAVVLSIAGALFLQRGVPVLPFMGASVLLLNFRAILPDRKEAVQILIGTAVILTIFTLLW